YNTYGELASYTASSNGSPLYTAVYDSTTYPRDPLGRIVRKTETIGAVTTTHDYEYDAPGRLWKVRRNGTLVATYEYDDNGNRTSFTDPGDTWTTTVDEQDRLLQYGPLTYTYTANGELRTRHDDRNGQTTTYTYDVRGNLTRVARAGTVID